MNQRGGARRRITPEYPGGRGRVTGSRGRGGAGLSEAARGGDEGVSRRRPGGSGRRLVRAQVSALT